MTRQSPPTPYELLHRIAERRGAKVLIVRDRLTPDLDIGTLTLTVQLPDDEVPLALAALRSGIEDRTLDEAALSCLRQMRVRV